MSEWRDELDEVFSGISGVPSTWLVGAPSARDDQEFDINETMAEFVAVQGPQFDGLDETSFFDELDTLILSPQPPLADSEAREGIDEGAVLPELDGEDPPSLDVPDESRGIVEEFDPLFVEGRDQVREVLNVS